MKIPERLAVGWRKVYGVSGAVCSIASVKMAEKKGKLVLVENEKKWREGLSSNFGVKMMRNEPRGGFKLENRNPQFKNALTCLTHEDFGVITMTLPRLFKLLQNIEIKNGEIQDKLIWLPKLGFITEVMLDNTMGEYKKNLEIDKDLIDSASERRVMPNNIQFGHVYEAYNSKTKHFDKYIMITKRQHLVTQNIEYVIISFNQLDMPLEKFIADVAANINVGHIYNLHARRTLPKLYTPEDSNLRVYNLWEKLTEAESTQFKSRLITKYYYGLISPLTYRILQPQ